MIEQSAIAKPTAPYSARLPASVILFAIVGILLFQLGHNPLLGSACLVVGVVIAKMLWRVGEAQIPLFVCGYQWFQAFASVLQAELYGEELAILYGGPSFSDALWFSLAGVLSFSGGMAWAIRRYLPQSAEGVTSLKQSYERLSLPKLTLAWLAILGADLVLGVVLRIPGIATVWNPLAYLRLGAALLLFQAVFAKRTGYLLLLLVLVAETAIGFFSYFSTFKAVYFLLLLAAATHLHFRKSMWVPMSIGIVAVLALGLFWQTIKGDYRAFMSAGDTQSQEVNVSLADQVDYLKSSVDKIGKDNLQLAAINTLRRLEYVIFFGLARRQVPEAIPHAKGRLWGEAVSSVFMPRILFPKKQVFNDSDRTNEFCGIRVADATEGTSIGIGYIGESYIDFGAPLMFVPIFLFGLLVGGAYGLLVNRASLRIIGIGAATALIFSSNLLLESSNAKMLASVVSGFVVLWVAMGIFKKFQFTVLEESTPDQLES